MKARIIFARELVFVVVGAATSAAALAACGKDSPRGADATRTVDAAQIADAMRSIDAAQTADAMRRIDAAQSPDARRIIDAGQVDASLVDAPIV